MSKASILMVMNNYFGVGGHETVVHNLCIGLEKLGYETTLGAVNFHKNSPDNINKIKLKKFRSLVSNSYERRFDIIHNHQGIMNYYSLITPRPFIFHYHGAASRTQIMNLKISMALCGKKISKIICVSEPSFQSIKEMIGQIPVKVIYNGVDTISYNTNLPRPYTKGNPQLLFVGNLHSAKNVGTLIDAMELILKLYPTAHLQIVGAGKEYEHLQRKIKNKKLENHVELAGKLYKDEIKLRYASCDVFVSASTKEAHSLTAFEAMACGKPSVLADVPAFREIISETNTGLLFTPFDVNDFKNKLQQVYEKRHFFGSHARKSAEKYSWANACKQVAKIYEQIM